MIFRAVCASVLGALIASTTPAAAQTVEFRGAGLLQRMSSECRQAGYDRLTYTRFRYRPANLGSNPNEGRLTVYFDFHASSYAVPGGFTKAFKQAGSLVIGDRAAFFTIPAFIKLNRTQPGSVDERTNDVRIVGEIQNFGDIPGCTMKYDAPLFQQR